jgi:DNA-binding YbaB/EbfC family protein
MKKVQHELESVEIEGQGGSGLIKVTVTGRQKVKAIDINPSLLIPGEDDKEILQDLIVVAINDAMSRAEKIANEKMSSVTSGLPLPPGLKPF